MIIIYNTDCVHIQKRVVRLKRALYNTRVDLRRDSSHTREKEKCLSTSSRMTVSVAG